MYPDLALTTYLASVYQQQTLPGLQGGKNRPREEKKYQIFMMQDLNNQRLI